MQKYDSRDNSPEVKIVLEIAAGLVEGLANRDLKEAVFGGVCRGVTELLETLGVPGRPSLEIKPLDSGYASPDRRLRMTVGGEWCRYSPVVLERVLSRAGGALTADPNHVHRWLEDRVNSATHLGDADCHAVAEFFVLACLEILKAQPAVLLQPEQAAVYAKLLGASQGISSSPWATPFGTTWLQSILWDVLRLKISIAEMDTVRHVLSDGSAKGHSPVEIAEELIAALRPTAVEIRLTPEYLRQLTTADAGAQGSFGRLRDGVFYDLGLRYPEFKFVRVQFPQPNGFAFRINHLTTLPRTGLLPGQCLVAASVDQLRPLGIEGHAAADPIINGPARIVDVRFRQAVGDRFATWEPMEYLVSCFKFELLEHNACFVDLKLVRSYLDQLSGAAPALVSVVRDKVPEGRLTRALRGLAAEGISIRNMKSILESALIDGDDAFAVRTPDEPRLDPDCNLPAAIRIGLRRYLSYKFANGKSTLPVYLLHPSLEEALVACQEGRKTLSEAERETLLDSVRSRVGNEPFVDYPPAILTGVAARSALRKALVPELAWVPVLADRELAPELRVQPVGRIALETAVWR